MFQLLQDEILHQKLSLSKFFHLIKVQQVLDLSKGQEKQEKVDT